MEIYPAIDLMDGHCVRLTGGDFAARTDYGADPLTVARDYFEAGARWLHLVDLDGARDPAKRQLPTIVALAAKVSLRVQTGGGVRSEADVELLLQSGVSRVVIGSLCIKQPDLVKDILRRWGPEKIVLALDVRGGLGNAYHIATSGWKETSQTKVETVLEEYAGLAKHVLCTDIAKDGMMAGPNVDLYRHLVAAAPDMQIQASGGVSSLKDLDALRETNVAGVIIGKALYEKKFGVAESAGEGCLMLAKRIIPCLDVKDGVVVKGVQFRDHRVMGDILDLARRYSDEGADELVFYDITASSDNRVVDRNWIERVARLIDIPFCVAGGIRTVDDARAVLNNGADKISVNSPALERPAFITELADAFGTQCVVVGIDSRREDDGGYAVYQYTGDQTKTIKDKRETVAWAREAQTLGAGEIVLNCINRDGVRQGYDLEQLRLVRAAVTVPLIASGGAGEMNHFCDVFTEANVDGALAASVFHSGELPIPDLKRYLIDEGVEIRP